MLLAILAFTNSFIVLLRLQDDTYFQEQYNGTYYNGSMYNTGNTTIQDVSSSNNFHDVYKSFVRVWFFIFGAWDSVSSGNAGDDKMIMALTILFSLITSLIFFNMVM
jgi:hypothetical protein